MDKPKFVYVTYITTTPEKLWEALTNADFTEKYWFGSRVESDWKVGSPFTIRTGIPEKDWQGKVLQCDPPRLLSYTFRVSGGGRPLHPCHLFARTKWAGGKTDAHARRA